MTVPAVRTGLDVLVAEHCARLRGRRVGLLVHPASVDAQLRHAAPLLQASLGGDLRVLFGPQHGLRGETQDNMVEWQGFTDPVTGVPAYSLYGEVRKPTGEMLADIDTLVIDLQDVGARYYTFTWTMLLCLEACAAAKVRVVVLDRPNPIGGEVLEGNLLDLDYRSFVGLACLPMRHGLTMGELAVWLRDDQKLDVEVDVVAMEGWRRDMWFEATGLPWVLPSPNMPTVDTAAVYPGFCLLEGTTLSEGRGTTRPFEISGAPGVDPVQLAGVLAALELPGCVWRPVSFEPTFQKHAGQLCGGVQLHVTDRAALRSVTAALAVMTVVRRIWPESFGWKQPPYEYEPDKLPIDILGGGPEVRLAVEAGIDPREVADHWQSESEAFAEASAEHRRYV
jgi:uncharacterized protein YbbC (DUF1343 family)